jgi:hypothetical protein
MSFDLVLLKSLLLYTFHSLVDSQHRSESCKLYLDMQHVDGGKKGHGKLEA